MINGTFYYDFSIFVEDETASSTLLVRTRVSYLLEGAGEQSPGSEHGVVGNLASSDHLSHLVNWQPFRNNLLGVIWLMLVVRPSIFTVNHMELRAGATIVGIEPATRSHTRHGNARLFSQLSLRRRADILTRFDLPAWELIQHLIHRVRILLLHQDAITSATRHDYSTMPMVGIMDILDGLPIWQLHCIFCDGEPRVVEERPRR